jgi:hypothetical protein
MECMEHGVYRVHEAYSMYGMFGVTHLHFGRKPASIIAPDIPRPLLLKSASVMRVSMVTGVLDP